LLYSFLSLFIAKPSFRCLSETAFPQDVINVILVQTPPLHMQRIEPDSLLPDFDLYKQVKDLLPLRHVHHVHGLSHESKLRDE
jgi:hypothetical protein